MEELTALVVCGGLSTRMGRDKSLIRWHNMAQRYFLYQLLAPLCKSVFISCNDAQSHEIEPGYAYIVDDEKFSNTGPMAALLTAFTRYPKAAFILIGCDYPFISEADVIQLISNRNENDSAVSFFNETTEFYEPLLAVYENKIAGSLFDNFQRQQFSLQTILKILDAHKVYPAELKRIKSVDTPADYLIAVEEMKVKN